MKNTTILMVIVLLLIAVGIVLMNKGRETTEVNVADGESQQVTISMKNGNYYPQEIRIKANQPVEVTLDSSVSGCFRAFTVPELGVYHVSKNPSDKIVFTPTKTGEMGFACTMGMGQGRFIVE